MKRIWYIPGAISLVLLLPLCLAYMERKDVFKEHRSLTLTFHNIHSPEDTSSSLYHWDYATRKWVELKCEGPLSRFHTWDQPERKWKELSCDGPLATSENSIREFGKFGRTIGLNQDTIHGVRLNFRARTKWSTVIAAVDVAMADSNSVFWLNDTSIRTCWIPPMPPIPIDTVIFPTLACDIIPICGTSSLPRSRSERIRSLIRPILDGIVKFWPVAMLFLALTALSKVKLRRPPH